MSMSSFHNVLLIKQTVSRESLLEQVHEKIYYKEQGEAE